MKRCTFVASSGVLDLRWPQKNKRSPKQLYRNCTDTDLSMAVPRTRRGSRMRWAIAESLLDRRKSEKCGGSRLSSSQFVQPIERRL